MAIAVKSIGDVSILLNRDLIYGLVRQEEELFVRVKGEIYKISGITLSSEGEEAGKLVLEVDILPNPPFIRYTLTYSIHWGFGGPGELFGQLAVTHRNEKNEKCTRVYPSTIFRIFTSNWNNGRFACKWMLEGDSVSLESFASQIEAKEFMEKFLIQKLREIREYCETHEYDPAASERWK